MKFLLIFSIFLVSSAQAKSVKEMNTVLIQDLKKEIQKDDEKFRSASRKPASFEGPALKKHNIAKDPDKIEKNVKQLGHSEW
jgi:hypothetical protein